MHVKVSSALKARLKMNLLCVPVETQKLGGKALSSLVSATADVDSHHNGKWC